MQRRSMLLSLGAFALTGCSRIGDSAAGKAVARAADDLHRVAQRGLTGNGLVPEFAPSQISPFFRGNGTIRPQGAAYAGHVANGFADWTLRVDGMVQRPLSLTLDQIRALPQRTQITRHDCVEGWSAIGQWTGPQLSHILDLARMQPSARYVVFTCADSLGGIPYYESVDLDDAFHPQTIVAHRLNGDPLPIRNGAPLRMRIERQLGYKHAKYLTGITAVDRLDTVNGGKGGYWEDVAGYQWYAGI